MLVNLKIGDAKVLRAIARAGTGVLGRQLRIDFTRATKSGEFLDELVTKGLIERSKKPLPPDPKKPEEPEQFRYTYFLTKLGIHAAEYLEYDWKIELGKRV